MNTDPLPICRDCRWCRYPGEATTPCFHDVASRPAVDFITGASRPALVLCRIMRGPSNPCGVEARLFEQRETAA